LTLIQRTNQNARTDIDPQAQMMAHIEIVFFECGVADSEGIANSDGAEVSKENGWATWCATADTLGVVIAGATCGARGTEAAASTENGIKNFIDAANQSQKRVCAPLLRSTRVSIATTNIKTVDCQRWFVTALIMASSPF
jgi:hypothetical protein